MELRSFSATENPKHNNVPRTYPFDESLRRINFQLSCLAVDPVAKENPERCKAVSGTGLPPASLLKVLDADACQAHIQPNVALGRQVGIWKSCARA